MKKITKQETDKIFYAITSNGCREMDEVRFHQAVNEALDQVKNCSRVIFDSPPPKQNKKN